VRIVVVGAGITGAAAAWALARDGHDVRVVEQFDLDHVRGSSHGRSRIFRLAYTEPHWVELAREALAGWRELEA
jgi:sarcosine oxidase